MSKNLLCFANRYIFLYTTIFKIVFPQLSQAQEADTLKSQILNEVVISASRIKESYLKSATSIELLTLKQIQQSPALSYFDTI